MHPGLARPRWVVIPRVTVMKFLGSSLFRILAFAVVVTTFAPGQRTEMHFAPAVVYGSGGAFTYGIAAADLNGDGWLDLVVVNCADSLNQYGDCLNIGSVAVLLGNGDGTFQPAVTYSTGAYNAQALAVGDVNGDGIPDLIVANACVAPGHSGCVGETGAVSILLGNGDGTFGPAAVYSSGGDYASSVALGDLRGDGSQDVVVANSYCCGGSYSGSVGVLLGSGNGSFQSALLYPSGRDHAESVAIRDVNGDGIPDLIVANLYQIESAEGEVGVLLGNGDGTFQPAALYDAGGEYTYSVALGDLRGVGIPDVVVANAVPGGSVDVLFGNGDGTFQNAVTYLAHGLIGGGTESLAIGDVNGDGIPDVVIVEECLRLRPGDEVCEGTGQVNVILGNGDGTFQKTVFYSSAGYYGSGIAVADVNGDGRPDLLVANAEASESEYSNGSVAVLLNGTSYKSETALTSSPNPSQINQSVTFTATITPTPPNGELVPFYNGKTSLGTGTTKMVRRV